MSRDSSRANSAGANAKVDEVIVSVVETSEEINKAVVQLRVILEKVNNGDGSAAKFVNDGRLYESLLENSEQMQLLLQDLRDFVERSRQKGVPIKLK